MIKRASAFAPATVANVGVGFDIMGFALSAPGEIVTVERTIDARTVVINPIADFPELPLDPARNTATAGLVRLLEDRKAGFGLRVTLQKQIPVGSGMGGSAASAAAAIVAAAALMKKKLSDEELFEYAMIGEEVASGSRHGDNIAPCLFGGLTYVRSMRPARWTKIKTPSTLRCVVILPRLSVNTKAARKLLSPHVALPKVIEQSGNLAGFILGCIKSDMKLIGESLRDVMIEPQRAQLIPGFFELQKTALELGALGCSISGSGPAVFALVSGPAVARKLQRAWSLQAEQMPLAIHDIWVSPIAGRGARLVRR